MLVPASTLAQQDTQWLRRIEKTMGARAPRRHQALFPKLMAQVQLDVVLAPVDAPTRTSPRL